MRITTREPKDHLKLTKKRASDEVHTAALNPAIDNYSR